MTCESCSHYSNQGHKGVVSLDEAESWMALWHRRLRPRSFTLLGGEPTIHPRLPEFVTLARRYWPDSHIRIATNGWFLNRHPTLPQMLEEDGNAGIYLSVHHDAPEYQQRIRPILVLLDDWARRYQFKLVRKESYGRWTRRYQGFGAAMEPYDHEQPRLSWENCDARFCRQLFEGKIWKCAPITYLKLQDAAHGLSEKWRPYLQYQPLAPDCTDAELDEFMDREEESCCGMCAARPEKFKLPVPMPLAEAAASRRALELAPLAPLPVMATLQPLERRAYSVQIAPYQHGAVQPSAPAAPDPLPSRIAPLGLPLSGDARRGWKPYPIFSGATPCVPYLACHVSVLSPGVTPHPPHHHLDEEILVLLAGEAELLIANREGGVNRHRLKPGSFVYYPANQGHTIHNPAEQAATFLMFKWRSDQAERPGVLGTHTVACSPEELAARSGATRFFTQRVFEGPTRHLRRLHGHATVLQPGCGYKPHVDAYDVAIVTLRGTVATLGQNVGESSVIFYAAGEPHGMTNVGSVPAVYLVFEFHG